MYSVFRIRLAALPRAGTLWGYFAFCLNSLVVQGGLTAGVSGGTAGHGQNKKMGEPQSRHTGTWPYPAAGTQLERAEGTGLAEAGVQS